MFNSISMAFYRVEVASFGPATVAVHDNGKMRTFRVCHFV